MKKMMRISVVATGIMVSLCIFGFFQDAKATDFPTALEKTISQVPDGADVAGMGNASTSLTSDYSTRNPGALDAMDAEPRNKVGAAVTYASIGFKDGPAVKLYSISGGVRLPVGTLQVVYSDGSSKTGTIDEFDTTLKFDHFPSINVQYGAKLKSGVLRSDDEVYAGIGYAYAKSKLSSRQFVGTPATTFTYDIVSESSSDMVETGMLYRIAKVVNFGAYYSHSWISTTDTVNDFTETAYSQTDQLRIGISVKVTPLTLVSADYRHLYLPGNQHDDQYFAGVEQYLIKDALALYGGWANGGATAGLGIYFLNGGFNIAYMHHGFRSMEEFLGKSEMVMASLYINF
jgi:hypothetical protein